MRTHARILLIALAALVASARSAGAEPVRLAADTTLTLPSGSSFPAPGGWFVSRPNGLLLLEDPERQLKVAFRESADSSASAAIRDAWQALEPGFSRAIARTVAPPVHDGWDELVQDNYVTTAQEGRMCLALARRKGATWLVNLVDGPVATLEKRSAQVNTAVLGWKPPGLRQESFAGRAAHELDAGRLATLERFIEDARVRTKVPGAAIAIVQNGRVVYEKGFGVRTLGTSDPVTPKTLFMIGSTSKSLTTLMMARLVDEGRFDWDTPVVRVYPPFALADPVVTPRVTMARTVCACTGLPRQDMEFLFEYAHATPESCLASMRRMTPTTGFGETFQYSNTMVATGGYVAAHAAYPAAPLGAAYDRAMQTRIFDPLGMNATTLDTAIVKTREHATPHGRTLAGEFVPLPLEYEAGVVSVRPAGAVWSNVEDMSRYLMTELAAGVGPDGTRIVSTANVLRRRQPGVRISDNMSYGLGLMVGDDHGIPMIEHGGNNLGFSCDMYFMPTQNVGVVLLTNGRSTNFFASAVRRRLMEILFDGREDAAPSLAYGVQQEQEGVLKALEGVSTPPGRAWIEGLAGRYANAALGIIEVRAASTPVLDAGEWTSTVGEKKEPGGEHVLVLTGAPLAGLQLIPGWDADRPTLTLKAAQQQYTFTRVATRTPRR